jgi:hypothetical protein
LLCEKRRDFKGCSGKVAGFVKKTNTTNASSLHYASQLDRLALQKIFLILLGIRGLQNIFSFSLDNHI